MGKRKWLHQTLLLLVCSICFSMPFVEIASGLPMDPDEPDPGNGGTYTGTYAPSSLTIAGKTLRRVDPGFTNSYGGGFDGIYFDYYVLWYHTNQPTSQDPNKCWGVNYYDKSVRKDDRCWATSFEFEYADSNGWAIKKGEKYMSVSWNGDVRVNKDSPGAQEKFYIYQDINQPDVYYIKANSNGKWICSDWTGWVVANRDAPYDWERVWFDNFPF